VLLSASQAAKLDLPTSTPLAPLSLQRRNLFQQAIRNRCISNARDKHSALKVELGCQFVDYSADPPTTRSSSSSSSVSEAEGGVQLVGVVPGKAAAVAGLQDFDVVDFVDISATPHTRAFKAAVLSCRPGQTATFRIRRPFSGVSLSLPVCLGARDTDAAALAEIVDIMNGKVSQADYSSWFTPDQPKLQVPPAVAGRMQRRAANIVANLPVSLGCSVVDGPEGVHVVAVASNSAAAVASMRIHEVIDYVDGVRVTTADEFRAIALSFRAGDEVKLDTHRSEGGGVVTAQRTIALYNDNANDSDVLEAYRVMMGVLYPADVARWGDSGNQTSFVVPK